MRKFMGTIIDLLSLVAFALILYIKTFAVKYALVGNDLVYTGFRDGTIGAVLLFMTILLLQQPWRRWKTFWGIDLALTCVLLIDLLYGRYFHDMPSVSLLKQAKLAGEVTDSVTALLRPQDAIYCLDILLLVPLLWRKHLKQLWAKQSLGLATRWMLATVTLMIGMSLSQVSVEKLNREQPGLLNTFCDKRYVAVNIGMLPYHAADISNYLSSQFSKVPIEDGDHAEIAAHFSKVSTLGNYYGNMQGKNLIMVQLESFQEFVQNRTVNGAEITPNLNRLSETSLNFDNTYCQTATGGTSDAEFLSNTSMLPAKSGSAYYEFSGNTYASLPNVLSDQGYSTAVMHANKPDFYNRVSMYQALGFQQYESMNEFNIDEVFGLGLTDESFYRQAVAKMAAYQQPFYTFLITLSSHFPFTDEANPLEDDLPVGEMEGTLMGDYLHAIHYADAAIGQFIQELRAADLWEDSIVVFYGDHTAINYANRQLLAELLYGQEELSDLQWFEAQQVPLLIHLPGDALQGRRQLAAGQIDIYPTLANLLGFRGQYTLGQDLLNSKAGFVCFRSSVWATDSLACMGADGPLVDLATGAEQPIEQYQSETAKADETRRISDLILEHDLISSLTATATENPGH